MSYTSPQETLFIKKLDPSAIVPIRGSRHAAGYDLSSSVDISIGQGAVISVPTGIAVGIPDGYYGRVAPRSGLALKGVDVLGGVIDPDYTGEVKVLLVWNNPMGMSKDNSSSMNEFKISKGDRIAQLVLEKIITPSVQVVDNLEDTQRGTSGFGSTGHAPVRMMYPGEGFSGDRGNVAKPGFTCGSEVIANPSIEETFIEGFESPPSKRHRPTGYR